MNAATATPGINAGELADLTGADLGTARSVLARARRAGRGSEPARMLMDLPPDQWRPTLRAWLSAWLSAPAPSSRAPSPGGAGRRPVGGRGDATAAGAAATRVARAPADDARGPGPRAAPGPPPLPGDRAAPPAGAGLMESVRTCAPGEAPGRPPFDWLLLPRNRRSALRAVETAIRRGWLRDATPEHRAALMGVMAALLDADGLPHRQVIRVCRVLMAMDCDDRALDREELRRGAKRPQSPAQTG